MILICHSNYRVLNKNGNMLNGIGDVSVKDFLAQMSALKQSADGYGVLLKTSDEVKLEDGGAILFIDAPNKSEPFFEGAVASGKPLFLWAWESSIINTRNSIVTEHENYKYVFTYDDLLVDNVKYFKVAYSFNFPNSIAKSYKGKKLCCLISGNKYSDDSKELYSHRIKTIEWFENNNPSDFDLYGKDWDKTVPAKTLLDRLKNRSGFNAYLGSPRRKSYRGEIEDKKRVYEKYRFSICYENAWGLAGYISEKIFDCFFSGCVPIYWGAPNINSYVPSDCYVDRRKFRSEAELYYYLNNMSEVEYFRYLRNIEKFIVNAPEGVFGMSYFTRTILSKVVEKPV